MVILRKYGEATTIPFGLFEIDGVDKKIDAVWVLGDVKLRKDTGAEANVTVGFADRGQGYTQPLAAADMEFATAELSIVDQGTKTWLDPEPIIIETYGHVDSQHPNMGIDLASILAINQTVLVDYLTDIKDVGLGKWVVDPMAGTLTLYRIDGITVLKVFDLTESSDIIPAYVARVPAP